MLRTLLRALGNIIFLAVVIAALVWFFFGFLGQFGYFRHSERKGGPTVVGGNPP